jgi:hypothetical protein
MPQNVLAQFVCPSPNVWDFDEKRLNWASVVRDADDTRHAVLLLNLYCSFPLLGQEIV